MATARQPSQDIRTHLRLPLHLDPQPEGVWTITSPLVPEFLTEGDTLADYRGATAPQNVPSQGSQ